MLHFELVSHSLEFLMKHEFAESSAKAGWSSETATSHRRLISIPVTYSAAKRYQLEIFFGVVSSIIWCIFLFFRKLNVENQLLLR